MCSLNDNKVWHMYWEYSESLYQSKDQLSKCNKSKMKTNSSADYNLFIAVT